MSINLINASYPNSTSKIFIIGLPRTGTTSMSVALLNLGFKVAHQAFTQQTFELANVVSDAPCFSDYRQLHRLYPNAKFIYLDRALDVWLPSMQMLLGRMLVHLDETQGRFHPILKRSFNHSFGIFSVDDPMDDAHLIHCYQFHKQQVFDYFTDIDPNSSQFIALDPSHSDSFAALMAFLEIDSSQLSASEAAFPHLNRGRNVASWDEYKHENKISSNASGPNKRKFFSYKLDDRLSVYLPSSFKR
ncbi:sulfotransferase family protein [Shewanella sp. Isolate11]|uniref:sulfotransferase family protein n=1 Tax=Shewanella sp. Isolate11 TaxID=2908530 RepID=UPI001EFED71F|nr:sulfotransferase family protein [Shewanella sp. Isolate11]MCG9698134.1 sulfotransferase family protein [Shewanella sp. Isolate11]